MTTYSEILIKAQIVIIFRNSLLSAIVNCDLLFNNNSTQVTGSLSILKLEFGFLEFVL